MKEGEKKRVLCFVPSVSREWERKFLCERCQIRRNFLPFLWSDREERIPPALAPATATIKFSFRREAIKTERKEEGDLGNYALWFSLSLLSPTALFKKPYVCSPAVSPLHSTSPFSILLSAWVPVSLLKNRLSANPSPHNWVRPTMHKTRPL